MSLLLYNMGIRSYNILLHLAAPFNKKASLWVEGRKNFFSLLQSRLNKKTGPIVWFHCASLGEFEQTRPLIEKIKKEYPGYNLLITFFSPSGYEIRKNYELTDFVFYLPIDTAYNADKFVRVVNPRLAFFAKYEFWHHYLNALHTKNIPTISFSAIFRKEQVFFKPQGGFFLNMLKKFDHIFVQNSTSITLLKEAGINNCSIAGDTRFDRVKEICDNRKNLPLVEKFKNNQMILVAGSTWSQDMNVLYKTINDSSVKLKYIIAPHEIKEQELSSIEQKCTKKSLRFSQLNESNANSFDILLIDNIGLLSSLYQYGEIAYVGGAFGKGLHNILEAATYGQPVLFGPSYKKFNEAIDLVKKECAFPVSNEIELYDQIRELIQNASLRKNIFEKTQHYVISHTGATQKIIDYCRPVLEKENK